jgi:hypothetical protein
MKFAIRDSLFAAGLVIDSAANGAEIFWTDIRANDNRTVKNSGAAAGFASANVSGYDGPFNRNFWLGGAKADSLFDPFPF